MFHIKILISTSITSSETSIFTRRKEKYRITTFRNSRLFSHIFHNIRNNTIITRLNKTKAKRISFRRTIRKIFTCGDTPTLFYKMKNSGNIRKMLRRKRPNSREYRLPSSSTIATLVCLTGVAFPDSSVTIAVCS
jgi:hypothetical protein